MSEFADPMAPRAPTEVYGEQDLRYPDPTPAPAGWGMAIDAALGKSSVTQNIIDHLGDVARFESSGATDPEFDPSQHLTGYEEHADYLWQAQNGTEMEMRKRVIDRDRKIDENLKLTGWRGTVANVAVGVLDPVSLATLFVPVTGGLRVATTLRGAAAGAATLGAITAGEEVILHKAQPGRTQMESIYGVGGGVLFGGLLGGVAGKIAHTRSIIDAVDLEALGKRLTTSAGTHPLIDYQTALKDIKDTAEPDELAKIAQWEQAGHKPQAIVRALDQNTTPEQVVVEDVTELEAQQATQNGAIDAFMGAPDGSVGAMRAGEALELAGGSIVLRAARATPIGRLAQATVNEMQSLGLKLNNTAFRFIRRDLNPEDMRHIREMKAKGATQAQIDQATRQAKKARRAAAQPMSADTELKKWTHGALGKVYQALRDGHNEYRRRMKAAGQKALSFNEFRVQAGYAKRDPAHPIPEARAAAMEADKHLFRDLFLQGSRARLFDPYIRSLARRESDDLYKVHLSQRKDLKRQSINLYKTSARAALKILRQSRTASRREIAQAERDAIAGAERAYEHHIEMMQEKASKTLLDEFAKYDEADAAARENAAKSVKAQFETPIKEAEAKLKAHKEKIRGLFGQFQKYVGVDLWRQTYTRRIAEVREAAANNLEAQLKFVDWTDKVTRAAITKDVEKDLRIAIRKINKEGLGEAEKRARGEALRARKLKQREFNQKVRELNKQLDEDLEQVTDAFTDLTPAEFADAVHLAYVGDLAPEYLSRVMRESVDAVKKVIDAPEFANYLTRVYDQEKLKVGGGEGFRSAVAQYFIGQGVAAGEAREIAVDAYAKITGYGGTARTMGVTAQPISQAAPQLERTLAVPDEVLAPWLQHDLYDISHSYAHSIGARLELAKISKDHGKPGAWRLTGDLKDIQTRYEEAKRMAPSDKERERLDKEYHQGTMDLEATANRILGVYDLPKDPTGFISKLATTLKHTNFMARMGGMVPASFSDVAAPALAMGLSRAYGPALSSMLDGTLKAAIKMSTRQLQTFGTATELLQPLWAHVPAELGDAVMPGMQAASQVFSRMSGISHWNMFGKSLSGVMIQHDMLSLVKRLAGKDLATLSKADRNALSDLARYGIREDMIDGLAKQPIKEFGTLKLADTDNWTDPQLVAAYRNSLVKMVDTFIVTPSAGDKFRWVRGQWPGLLAQFQSFAVSAHNKVFIPFMQDPVHARQVTSMLAGSLVGAMTYAARMYLTGRQGEVQKMIADREYYAIARQVVANSSLLTMASTFEGMIGSAMGAQGAGRYSGTGPEIFGGPSTSLLGDVIDLTQMVGQGQTPSMATAHKVRNMTPFMNTWVANLGLNKNVGPIPGLDLERKLGEELGLKETRRR